MNDVEFDERAATLRLALVETIDVLTTVGETHWCRWFSEVLSCLDRSDARAFDRACQAFGGMGSFNDFAVHPVAGHGITESETVAMNSRLARLRSVIWAESDALRDELTR